MGEEDHPQRGIRSGRAGVPGLTRASSATFLASLCIASLALLAGTAPAGASEEPVLEGGLVVSKRVLVPGKRVALRVQNTGTAQMLFGLSGRVERRRGGRWVSARRVVCPRSCAVPAIGLVAAPGSTVGPRYGRLRDTIRFPRTAPPGRYRITKHVSDSARPRQGTRLRAVVRLRPGRLTLNRQLIQPGARVAMKIRNLSRRWMTFGLFVDAVERWDSGGWVDAHPDLCPDGCPVPSVGLAVGPGRSTGPRYGMLRDTVTFPRSAPEGLYRLTKRVRKGRPARAMALRARVSVRSSESAPSGP